MSDESNARCLDCRTKDEQITDLEARVALFEARQERRRVKVCEALSAMMESGDDISGLLESIQQGGHDLGDFLFPTP